VFSRRPEPREKFADDMSQKLGISVTPVDSAEACVQDTDIIITITNSPTPVLFGEWLEPGTHINAAGAMRPERRELDDEAVRRCDILVADDVEQAKGECGDFIFPIQKGIRDWDQVRNLSEIVDGSASGRNKASDITLFESQGMALEDIAAGIQVYKIAMERGAGQEMSISKP
jgi:ornithine cyclodeaminase